MIGILIFFHSSVKGKRKRNKIQKLQKEDRSWTKIEEEIGQEVENQFEDLFCSKRVDQENLFLEGISPTIIDQMNTELIEPVEEKEIKEALFSMNPNKSPDPDGMTPIFF